MVPFCNLVKKDEFTMNEINQAFQLLMAPPPNAAGGDAASQLLPTLLTFGAVFLIFYFLIIRPQNKKQKEQKKMLDQLKKGDKVQTIGGIRGVIFSVKQDTVVLKVDDNAKIEFSRGSISGVLDAKEEKKDEKDSAKDDTKAEGKKSSKNAKNKDEVQAESAE